MLREDPEVGLVLAQFLAENVDAESRILGAHVFGDARQRIARQLLALAQRDPDDRLVVRVTHQQLADATGTVREHASRIVKDMRRRRLLHTARGTIEVLDEPALRRLATAV